MSTNTAWSGSRSLLDAAISIEEHVDPATTLRSEACRSDNRSGSRPIRRPLELVTRPRGTKASVQLARCRSEAPYAQCRAVICCSSLAAESPSLEDWERDVLGIVRGEMLYFHPQMQTKIINEGWASYWHVQIMRELNLDTDDHVEFAKLHSQRAPADPGRLNPYYLGFTLLNDIERRWNALDGCGTRTALPWCARRSAMSR